MKNSNAHILIIDDDENNRYMLNRMLTREGYENISLAPDGETGLELLLRTPVDLVLLDILMPGIDGHEVLKQMKISEELRSIPVIIITVLDDSENAARCIGQGADDYLPIPYNPIVLRARVSACLERNRLQKLEGEIQQRRIQRLADLANDSLVLINSSGHVINTNGASEHTFGVTREQLEGMSFDELVSVPEGHRGEKLVKFLLETDDNKGFGHRSDGTFNVEVTAQALSYNQELIAISLRDLTEHELIEARHEDLENQLIQSQKMESLGRLAGGVAHDFNNFLTVMSGYVDLLEHYGNIPDNSLNALNGIRDAVEKSKTLTKQLLTFSRQSVREDSVFCVNDMLQKLQPMITNMLGIKIDYQFLPADELNHITADQNQIEQVLLNLVANAADAMPDGGQLTISTQAEVLDQAEHGGLKAGDYIRIDVTDTGHGIPKENLHSIFEPFFTTKPMDKGTGLGLSLAYGILSRNAGAIVVESEVDRGSTFRLYLPQAAAIKAQRGVQGAN